MLFELKKILKRRPVKLVTVLIILIILSFQIFTSFSQQKQLHFLENTLQRTYGITKKIYSNKKEINKFYTKDMIKSISSRNYANFTYFYFKSIEPRQGIIESFPIQTDIAELPNTIVLKTGELDDTYDELKIVTKKHIVPLTPPTILTNPDTLINFAGTPQEKNSFIKYNKRFYLQSWYFLWNFFSSYKYLIFYIIIVLLFSGSFVSELNEKNKTINFLIARRTKLSIFIHKIIVINLTSIFFSVAIIALSVLAISILYGCGSLNYPVHEWIYGKSSNTIFNTLIFNRNYFNPYKTGFITLSTYLIKSLSLFVIGIIFINSINFLISVIVRNEVISTIGTIISILFIPFSLSMKYSPFTYLNIDKISTNYIGFHLHTGNHNNYLFGMIIVLTYSVIILLITYTIFKLREKGR